jgi:hypothetical protein
METLLRLMPVADFNTSVVIAPFAGHGDAVCPAPVLPR